MKFTKIPETTFSELQLNAGIIVKNFDPEAGEVSSSDILGATTGGISFAATPTYTDYGADIDNAPKNTKELKRLDGWAATLSGTFISVNGDLVKSLVASADVITREEQTGTKFDQIKPRNDIDIDDFADIWWVGDYSDKNDDTAAGCMAIHLINALSTGGFSIKTADRAKGQFAFSYEAHYSIDAQDNVPFEIYIKTVTA